MKFSRYIAAISFAILLGAWSCNAIAATATGSFNYDFSIDVPCSATVTKDCIDHFSIADVTNPTSQVILTSIVAPTPAVSPIPFSFKVGGPYGNRKWAVTAVAKDSSGAFVASDPSPSANVVTKPGAPAAFVVNLQ